MINKVCCICGEYVSDVWVLVVSDDKAKMEFSGCKNDIDNLQNKINAVKNVDKKNIKQILKEINYKEMD
jgi:hypothetical protein